MERKGNPLQSAWDQVFSITKHANGSTTEVFSGSEGSDLAFDGVRPREARFDSSGN